MARTQKSPLVQTVLPRWLSVIALTYVIAVGIHVVLPWSIAVWQRSVHLKSANHRLLLAALWCLVAVCGFLVASLIRIRFRHLRVALKYPPQWLAWPTAILLVLSGHRLFSMLRFSNEVVAVMWPGRAAMAIGALIAGVSARSLMERLRAAPEPQRTEPLARSPKSLDWPVISAWAQAEQESEIDLLNHARIADRLAKVITDDSVLHRRATALIGPLGCGKSSVLRRVEWQLTRSRSEGATSDNDKPADPAVWTCWVSCWGLDDSKLLAGHVLRTLVDRIEREVDATGLREVPDSYLKMLGSTKLGPLEGLLRRDQHEIVREGLSRIPPILKALDARLVLFIEDGDRAKGKDFDPAHLEGLVSKLRDVDRIACVMALDRDRIEFDVSKLCEHVELMPILSVESVREVLWVVRQHCLEVGKFIDPRTKESERDLLDLRPSDEQGLVTFVRRHHTRTVCDSMADVIATPRQLKHVVRRIVRAWERLYGEVDLDHLIVVSAIKECSPKVFTFLLANVDPIRQKVDDFNKSPEASRVGWEELLKRDPQSALAAPLVRVLGLQQVLGDSISRGPSYQGAHVDEPTDYFRRLLSEEVEQGDVRDQTVLADIDAWVAGASKDMVRKLSGELQTGQRYAAVWRHFSPRIPSDRIGDLIDELFEPVLAKIRRDGIWELPIGTDAAWSHAMRIGGLRLIGAQRVSRMATAGMAESLESAIAVFREWRQGAADEDQDRRSVREAILAKAQELYSTSEGLVAAVSRSNGTGQLAGLIELGKRDAFPWLVPSVIAAMKCSPEVMVPQVAELVGTFLRVTRTDPTQPSERYELNRELVEAVFGDRTDELLAGIFGTDPGDQWFCREAKAQAGLWLEERRNPQRKETEPEGKT